jgi:hypothetical protein
VKYLAAVGVLGFAIGSFLAGLAAADAGTDIRAVAWFAIAGALVYVAIAVARLEREPDEGTPSGYPRQNLHHDPGASIDFAEIRRQKRREERRLDRERRRYPDDR